MNDSRSTGHGEQRDDGERTLQEQLLEALKPTTAKYASRLREALQNGEEVWLRLSVKAAKGRIDKVQLNTEESIKLDFCVDGEDSTE